MLVHSLASKYARFVVIVRHWIPPPSDHWTPPPLLKSDDLFLGNQEILDPPLSKILDTPLIRCKFKKMNSSKLDRVETYYKIIIIMILFNDGRKLKSFLY